MIVDLNPLPYNRALELIKWCFEHNINREKCVKLLNVLSISPCPEEVDWTLDIPDKHVTFFILKWSGQGL